MEYNKIPQMLKRHTFEEKMRVLQIHSRQLMAPKGLVSNAEMSRLPLPWELETFLLFSVVAKEWKHDNFKGRDERKFINAINAIKGYVHPALESNEGSRTFGDNFLMAACAVQFDLQEYYPYKLYRFNYYFTFESDVINMRQLFEERFGCSYQEFAIFAQFLWMLSSQHSLHIPQQLLGYLSSKFEKVVSQLTISRTEYINELNAITSDISDYIYCLRPSYTYPCIREDNCIYLPLPHLLIRSVTSSLMYRLTEGNNKLSEKIGKEVLESYLYKIIAESNLFDEVFSEIVYLEKKREQRSLDVLTRKDDIYIFFDSKMHSPPRNLRIFDDATFNREVELLAKSCKQIYLHIHDRFPSLYNPFSKEPKKNNDDVFGIVVIRDNPYIQTDYVYKKTAEMLNIDVNSSDYNWLRSHVGIVTIYDIERYCFSGSNIIDAVIANKESGQLNNFWLAFTLDKNKIANKDVRTFRNLLSDEVLALAEECKKTVVIS